MKRWNVWGKSGADWAVSLIALSSIRRRVSYLLVIEEVVDGEHSVSCQVLQEGTNRGSAVAAAVAAAVVFNQRRV